ncbi:uncharacterized protein [Montipora foliosa]|uniref:uncharacterized protein n=1 Tax=Montipora foliosa TaxID=591990 RepID=UPI0035F2018C
MFSWKTILVPLVIASVGDLFVTRYFPEGGSRLGWTLNQAKQLSVKLQKAVHRIADAICNKPEECKKAADEFFVVLHDIPQDIWDTAAAILRNATSQSLEKNGPVDDETALKRQRAKRGAANYDEKEVDSIKGNVTKAEEVIKSLRFSSYEENNLCDLKEGIPASEYDDTVDEIANLINMPETLKKVIKRAKSFTRGNVLAVNKLQFKTQDGNLVFGRVAVLRSGDTLDIAYSLHSVEYELKSKQRAPKHAENFVKFSESLDDSKENDDGSFDSEENDDGSFEISVDLRQDFLAFFHKQAIEGFVKHCDYLLKTMDNEPQILQHMGVGNGKTVEKVEDNPK